MNKKLSLVTQHNFTAAAAFRIKVLVLTGQRFLRNLCAPTQKFKQQNQPDLRAVIAISESDLWNASDNEDNWIMTAGKIENLRIATKKLNGLEVKANKTFSFWRHIGNPNIGQGYVTGREVREGCIIPTIAGGLCQLSNALYDAAIKAGFDIVERHKHTKIIKGSLAEQNRDATVKWNYIDLRFRATSDFRIEAELTRNKLTVKFRSDLKNTSQPSPLQHPSLEDKLNDCYSCGNSNCFKHRNNQAVKYGLPTTTFILDEQWKEFDDYIQSAAKDGDHFIVPLRKNRLISTQRYAWKAIGQHHLQATTHQGIYRAIRMRLLTPRHNIFALSLQLDERIAKAAAKKMTITSTHVVISQNLLPFLYETGCLGGRTFDVLMTRLPMQQLHERLDFALKQHPDSSSLNDFRANVELMALENKALNQAEKIITPHSEIGTLFSNKTIKLSWHYSQVPAVPVQGKKILFPAASLGRKGAYLMKRLAQELQLDLVIPGKTTEHNTFWEDVSVEQFSGNFDEIGCVVYPTYIEHHPVKVLQAISRGIPVITTTACGLESSDSVIVVSPGNFEQLKNEVLKLINHPHNTNLSSS